MPRWLFLTCVVAVVLAVIGSALVVLRSTPSSVVDRKPAAGLRWYPAAGSGTARPA